MNTQVPALLVLSSEKKINLLSQMSVYLSDEEK